ncbi:uncharacterized protein EV154DRAFT_501727 [Mucor mucedo]|uniref:uncharacterized protein n=1 Tax=Mucor mucedo TaxID=29922 RepID=UPI00221EA1C6|nr:uncharacterized protein EV154DRAFT_501727 [Mucor mucedo]KAI7893343.1 hypothetical protein EV154DRAFT_501727 [Mucor mucedo]
MGNWSTLNKGAAAPTKDAIEIQVERLLEAYQNTLKCHQKGQLLLAKEKYKELVSHALVKKEPNPKKKTGTSIDLVEESPLSTLRFLVFKNYAAILKDEFNMDQQNMALAKEALEYYLQAVKIDPTEYTLWYYIGYFSHLLGQLRFARLAYETGFYVNSNERTLKLHVVQPNDAIEIIKSGKFTPMQWKCLEGLCSVLFDIGDYGLCNTYIGIIMDQVNNWDVGLKLRERMKERDIANLEKDTTENLRMDICRENQSLPITLEKADWLFLAESLLKEYKRLVDLTKCEENKGIQSTTNRLLDTKFVNQSLYINVEMEEKTPTPEPMELEHMTSSPMPIIETDPSKDNSVDDPALSHDYALSVTGRTPDVPGNNEEPADSHKRKREEDDDEGGEGSGINNQDNNGNNSNSENDEESEAEEKRLSLRASKRQREKIANEESSRLKMLEEEKQFINKVQSFYDKVAYIPTLYRKTWEDIPNSEDASTTLFWEWFDHKILELDSSYCWEIDTLTLLNSDATRSDSIIFGDGKVKNLTLFTKSTINQIEGPSSNSALKEFIIELNNNNSGITDCLCKLVSAIIKNDPITTESPKNNSIKSNEFLDLITDTIGTLETNFVETILTDATLSGDDQILMILRICEYLIDRLIRNIITTAEENAIQPTMNHHGRRRVSTTSHKNSKAKLNEALMTQCQYWINLLESIIFSTSLNVFFKKVHEKSTEEADLYSLKKIGTELRYWIIKGKFAQCNNDIEKAYSWYVRCKNILKSSIDVAKPISINIKSMYDSTIDLASVDAKLSLLQVGKIFVTAKQKIESEDFKGVITDLEPIIKPKLNGGDLDESNETIQMMNMLAKAYVKTNQSLEAWNCYVRMFCYLIKQLMDYGGNHVGRRQPYLSKNEDTNFFRLMNLINSITDNLVSLIQQDKQENWLPLSIDGDLANKLSALLRMSIYYIFRHPDFVPLVNNFSTPDVPPHTPSKVTKSNGFNDIVAKAWVLQSYLIQHVIQHNEERNTNGAIYTWAELLKELHEELGEREVCGAGKRIFLSHLMDTLTKADDLQFRREIYQCYHCLYGVHLAAESDMIEEHHCVHSELDRKACEPLFSLVVNSAVERLENRTLLKTDLKDVIDTVSELFDELPKKNVLIRSSKNIIETYLNSDIELHSSIDGMLRAAIIPSINISSKKTNTSNVYYKIFWIRGKTIRLQIKNKARANNEKTMLDLEKAAEEFTDHLILNPDDADGWCELGACFQLRADVELDWSASNIGAHRDLIGEYQRKSCHAYLRSIYLADSRTKKELAKNELFTNFGNLIYAITSSPMNMKAFSRQNTKHTLGEDKKLMQAELQPPSSKAAYKLALIMYNYALRYNIPDNLEWRCYYMIGKCSAKLDRPPREVLEWYLQAIRRTNSKQGKHDQDLESIYIFCSYLVKYFYQGKLEAADVQEFLARERALHHVQTKDNVAEQEVVFLENSTDAVIAENSSLLSKELKLQSGYLSEESANAYNAIFLRLSEMRIADNKSWQHRTIYRIAWMYHNIYQNSEKAKSELLKLFNLKVITKSYITIWKPGFELPGRHYKYIYKYTLFLIDLAWNTRDTQTLKHLYRKLRRAQALLLNDKEVFKKAYIAYLEIIKKQLRDNYHAKNYMKMIKESRIDKTQFQELCVKSSAEIIADRNTVNPELYGILQDISELKRLLHGFITASEEDTEKMDKVIWLCYATLIFGGVKNEDKRGELVNAISTTEDFAESRSRKDLRAVLLAQAKSLMQNITSTSK